MAKTTLVLGHTFQVLFRFPVPSHTRHPQIHQPKMDVSPYTDLLSAIDCFLRQMLLPDVCHLRSSRSFLPYCNNNVEFLSSVELFARKGMCFIPIYHRMSVYFARLRNSNTQFECKMSQHPYADIRDCFDFVQIWWFLNLHFSQPILRVINHLISYSN